MKVAKTKTNVQVEGVTTKQFGIVFDRHMVNILSNQLYEDKVLALIRELSTNALDSHRDAGCPAKPFDVHLPTWDDMNFWIRDYGTGMSPEKVDTVYRMYGASDRNESNDFTGCMGLGSKTPFCYHTKACVVDSWYEGIHYQYACFINEDGMPEISDPIIQEPSDEPSGVKVSMPARQGDIWEFENAAIRIYRFFEVAPNVIGKSITIDKPKYTLQDDNWKYDENERDGMKVVMGDVAYRVSYEALGELTNAQRQVVMTGFHVYADIGEVGVTASREGLDYTNRTKTTIRGYINGIIRSFNDKAQEDIARCKNLWEARMRFVEYERDSLRSIFDSTKITYDGKQLFDEDGYIDLNNMIKEGKIELYEYTAQSYRKPERRRIRGVRCNRKKLFYHNDLSIGAFVRSIAECQKHHLDVILVKFVAGIQDDDGKLISVQDIKNEFYNTLGFDESYLTNISTIPSPTMRSASGAKRGKTTKVVQFRANKTWDLKSDYWKNVDIDIEDGGVYVEFNRFNIKLVGDESGHPSELTSLITMLESSGIEIPAIYGVKTAHLKSFKDSELWTNFWDWAIIQIFKKIDGVDLDPSQEFYKHEVDNLGYGGYYSKCRKSIETLKRLAKQCDDSTYLVEFIEAVEKVEKLASGWEIVAKLRQLCTRFNIAVPKASDKQEYGLKKMEDKIYNIYPLLLAVNEGQILNNLTQFGIYVNAADKL